ncbi:MFS general substrate transporter [Ramicandelaber brevisporus]|nr:MFS general substrate transporter [Ramicandelaber brevisporus]
MSSYSETKASSEAILSPPEERRFRRKLHWHILPIIFLLHLCAFIDRVSVSSARLYSLEQDLNMTPTQFSWALSVFFIPFILLEVPMNLVLSHVSASKFLAFLCFGWSVSALGMAFVQNFAALVATRALLGLFESGLFCGAFYYLTLWYTPEEQGFAFAWLIAGGPISGIVGGLIASGVGEGLHGAHGYSAWRWLFLIEALPSLVLSFATFFFLPDSPKTAKFLSEREREFAVARIGLEGNASQIPKQRKAQIMRREVTAALTNPYNIIFALCYFCYGVSGYSVGLLLATLLFQAGFIPFHVQLLSIPQSALLFVLLFLFAWTSSRFKDRFWHIAFGGLSSLVFFLVLAILGADANRWVRYAFLILSNLFLSAMSPLFLAWGSSANLRSTTARMATFTAMTMMLTNLGGFVGSYFYNLSEAPDFRPSHWANFGIQTFFTASVAVMGFLMWRYNRNRAPGEFKYGL